MPQKKDRKNRPKSEKRVQFSQDKKMLAISSYLISIHPKGATRHGIATNAALRSQEGSEFKGIMNQLVEMNWVKMEESQSVGGYEVYFITEEGRTAINIAKDLARNDSSLSKLNAFENILDF